MPAPDQLLVAALVAIAFPVWASNLIPRSRMTPLRRAPRNFTFPVAVAAVSLLIFSINPF